MMQDLVGLSSLKGTGSVSGDFGLMGLGVGGGSIIQIQQSVRMKFCGKVVRIEHEYKN